MYGSKKLVLSLKLRSSKESSLLSLVVSGVVSIPGQYTGAYSGTQ